MPISSASAAVRRPGRLLRNSIISDSKRVTIAALISTGSGIAFASDNAGRSSAFS
jgi:hypothetical protein